MRSAGERLPMSLSWLWQRQGWCTNACELLAGGYNRFTEGLRHHSLASNQGTAHRTILTVPRIGAPAPGVCQFRCGWRHKRMSR